MGEWVPGGAAGRGGRSERGRREMASVVAVVVMGNRIVKIT